MKRAARCCEAPVRQDSGEARREGSPPRCGVFDWCGAPHAHADSQQSCVHGHEQRQPSHGTTDQRASPSPGTQTGSGANNWRARASASASAWHCACEAALPPPPVPPLHTARSGSA